MLSTNKVSDTLVGSRILLIDDSVSFQRITEALLESFGVASVITARGLAEGMHKMNYLGPDKFAAPKIDLILMDINLPDGNGIEACEYLSSYASNCDIPVVVISGSSDTMTINKAFEAGASDYLHKPLSRLLLEARLAMLMTLKSIGLEERRETLTPDRSIQWTNTGT